MRERDLAAAPFGIARTKQAEPVPHAARLDLVDEQLGQRHALLAHRREVNHGVELERRFQRAQREHRLGAAEELPDARIGAEAPLEGERRGMRPPAGQGLARRLVEPRSDVDEGRRAGPAVEILIGAADGEIDRACVERDRHDARRMAQVPDHQRARVVDHGRLGGHVAERAGPVIDMRQQDGGDVGGKHRRERFTLGQIAQRDVRAVRRQRLGDVEIGREALRLGDDDMAAGPRVERRPQRLVEVDRGAVGDDGLTGRRADDGAGQIAERLGQAPPAVLGPGADQVAGPLLVNRGLDLGADRLGHGAQRVAVEIDDALGQREEIAHRGQRVVAVALFGRCRHLVASVAGR